MRLSSTVSEGNNWRPSGTWHMPAALIFSGASRVMSFPWKVILPLRLRTIPEIVWRRVLLPAPLAPRTVTTIPLGTVSDTPWRASMDP